MEVTINKEVEEEFEYEEGKLGLRLNRKLLPIDEYAAREGISREMVEECGKLGVVQIRKYKGNLFVLDVPLSPYRRGGGPGEGKEDLVDKLIQSQKMFELAKRIVPAKAKVIKHVVEGPVKKPMKESGGEESGEAARVPSQGVVSGAVRKMVSKAAGEQVRREREMAARRAEDERVKKERVAAAKRAVEERVKRENEAARRAAAKRALETEKRASKRLINKPEEAPIKLEQWQERPRPIERRHRRLLEVRGNRGRDSIDESYWFEGSSGPVKTPELERFGEEEELSAEEKAFSELEESYQITDKLLIPIDELIELEETAEPIVTQRDKIQLEVSRVRGRPGRFWQVAAVLLFLFFVGTVFVSFWFYIDRQVQLDRLELAYTSVQKVYDDFAAANQQAEGLREELNGSRTEMEFIRSELNRSQAEAETAKGELKAFQEHNASAVEQLNEQIQSLVGRLAEASGDTSGK